MEKVLNMPMETNLERNKGYRYLNLLIAGLIISLLLRDIVGISVNKYLITGFCVVLMMAMDYENLISALAFCIPLFCGLPGKYILVFAIFFLMKRNGVNLKQIIYSVFVIIWEMIAFISYKSVILTELFGYILFAMLLFYLIFQDADIDYKKVCKCYLLGTSILCLFLIIIELRSAPSNWLSLFAAGKFRIGDTHVLDTSIMSLRLNANSLAFFSIVGISCAITLIVRKNTTKMERVAYFCELTICAIAGFLTVSRTWLLCVGILVIFLFLSRLKSPRTLITFLVATIVIYFIASRYLEANPDLFMGFNSRFESSDIYSGNGRSILFEMYWNVFWKNPRFVLLGTGVMDYREVTGIMMNGMHNATEQILVCLGVPGAVFFIGGLIYPIIKTMKQSKIEFPYWFPLIMIVLFIQSIQFLNPYLFMPVYALGIFGLKLGRDDQIIELARF